MKKEELIANIQSAFKDVKLEDGIGLWEAQGIDDYADAKTMLELRKKDERENWNAISYKDISLCASSLSFFDAKGMRFCLPKFLIFDILEQQVVDGTEFYSVDVLFTLGYNLDKEYQKRRFSLLDKTQKESITYYLKYKLNAIENRYEKYSADYGSSLDAVCEDPEYFNLYKILNEWEEILRKDK
ncbi:DUF6714 family protein [Flavobacterium johnsoniae]|uniref:Uncharacterized protein n=1 Tax=Flavobacterium johnsoniae (strain ATCC 17061 / DSM 2064 / JCM 8514 / BCRC 14874 / CCUG 350202 / NBRC 14942 / NCIMB 11054 / UW101) TaxID=376686 RepID=A5FK77_FLAJ1|nr:DUF6714 family protein [Flavobacterium johnsoniae]ABQ04391.1 hypothetical protein Fjoh_1359 [Flavobacterium johnsoniae UW101]OXE97716.1 hypothetical protein B0A63_16415 [Flavobacterium johnsoniae UW101]WQG83815.1 DUF6714 family protein [Flavobacterium johnsoniae UW101]SHK21117.1 hypothetical protein SAMN05444146_0785 [Flavobacterium johnsoniae]